MTRKRSTGLAGVTNLAVLAPLRTDMVKGFEPISYVERLHKVLDALQSARVNLRESELQPSVFPDVIGSLGILHHFRYALVPPRPDATGDVWQLSLNVTFDGGWEPYMRAIYRDIGTLLDLLFCHSPDYPGSRTSSYAAYCDWVRRYEVGAGIFYADSAQTLMDQQYLAEVEQAQLAGPAPDAAFAQLALPSVKAQEQQAMKKAAGAPLGALVLPLRSLKGLYRLSTYFPAGTTANADGDRGTLRRFAQSVLSGAIALMQQLDKLPPATPASQAWARAKALYADELAWLQYTQVVEPAKPAPVPCDPQVLQSHILGSAERMTHGALVLLGVRDAGKALDALVTAAGQCGPVKDGEIGYLVGFTYAGLQALDIHPQRLAALPQEFVDGMEARNGVLGDLRGNHPDYWARPEAYKPAAAGQRVDLKNVHVVIHLRLADDANQDWQLHPRLQQAAADLDQAGTGLRVLAVQPARSYRNETGDATNHFGFADGISQPVLPTGQDLPKTVAFNDLVRAGEMLLGRENDRGDPADAGIDPLLCDGTFLVIRKLRQRVDNLDAVLAKTPAGRREELEAKMMGRQKDGTPLAPLPPGSAGRNDFDYGTPAAGNACPFQSHMRRANPRDGRPYMPRILRRGMSYGPRSEVDRSTDRGVLFMAYCASISEQFETLQRWIAGGNNSGIGSAQADPFLQVPQAGESRTFRYLDGSGNVARADLGDQPLVQLEWGVYLFVPSLPALKGLGQWRDQPTPATRPLPPDTDASPEEQKRERARQILDDPDKATRAWEQVREGSHAFPQGSAYGHLVGRLDEVLKVMKDPGHHYSVRGYGDRMDHSIGRTLLGMDPKDADYQQQASVNQAILAIDAPTAFAATLQAAQQVLAQFPPLPPASTVGAARIPIDLLNFSDGVLAGLCGKLVGLPDPAQPFLAMGGRQDDNPPVPRCPGNVATASRYIFSPQPRADVERAGQQQGQAVLKAFRDWLATNPSLDAHPLAQDIRAKLVKALPAAELQEQLALNLAGVLLGFTPTVQGNFFQTLETWIDDESLWRHQQALYEAVVAGGAGLTYEAASQALRGPLLATMRQRPVPDMLWRSPVHGNEGVNFDPSQRVVLGLKSALTDPEAPDELMFGRDDRHGEHPTAHGCPGYAMGMGVLLGLLAALLQAGTLRPTGSPVLLILTPNG